MQTILQGFVSLELMEAGFDARSRYLFGTIQTAFCDKLLCLSGVGFVFNVAVAPPDNTIETRSVLGIVWGQVLAVEIS